MEIKEVKDNKKQYLSLLLFADEQENMIGRYDLFAKKAVNNNFGKGFAFKLIAQSPYSAVPSRGGNVGKPFAVICCENERPNESATVFL